ncbi:MAG: hypothetical protein A2840_00455 [Candidatus Buchananbacteria bacterium RIFCSPHIGHO2_01_FULL_47_11b]|uniref:Amine oxidase domain-containing protein n=1 Tax=Candidatus Buchananbacteria bacterium RIFCSPHIGHO2_01_FULL_47_11b TaxID=1797537 RepID=A0A1G1Y550_9BACT|nr:MAG: hypothetical protein A2840_00455 [Candidatus Buchananbacteria bacterium RIFCSPHIGHO2_01_FULL_47_11b]
MPTKKLKNVESCILGAGPAGYGTALELTKGGVKDILIIDRNQIVGGLARTEKLGGARFDVGPHRFFTKNQEINQLWHETLGNDFIHIKNRITRISYKNKFFYYPLKPFDTLAKLGPKESTQALFSFLITRLQPHSEPVTFEDWIVQKFGRKLFETFFKTYTEKVWGIPCNQIGKEWASQRIKGLDVISVIKQALLPHQSGKIKTLIDQFDYPILGAGMMYERMQEKVEKLGAQLWLGTAVTKFNVAVGGNKIESIEVRKPDGELVEIKAQQYFNSIPLTHFIKMLGPQEEDAVKKAADSLYYRDHITVNLLVSGENIFPDQWIYVHSPEVLMARIANYNNFSKIMAGGKNRSALSVEYFAFQHEPIWQSSNQALKLLAIKELKHLNLLQPDQVQEAWVVRETESYPTYYLGFQQPYEVLKNRLNQFTNLYPIGRGGLYKYNNQDHSTLSGILAARNYLKKYNTGKSYNLWDVNTDSDYHEGQIK